MINLTSCKYDVLREVAASLGYSVIEDEEVWRLLYQMHLWPRARCSVNSLWQSAGPVAIAVWMRHGLPDDAAAAEDVLPQQLFCWLGTTHH